MSERKLARVYCSRSRGAHEVGAVFATKDGPEVRYVAAVSTSGGTVGHETIWRGSDAATMGEAWCQACGKRLPIPLSQLREGSVKLSAEGMWRDPLGVLNRQRGAREE